jgi:D-serine deaminase-like pyridoxal phosphate-dependent protein
MSHGLQTRAGLSTKRSATSQHARLESACAALDAPFAAVDVDAFDANRDDLARRAAGTSIRLASKSVRCRALLRRAIDGSEAFRGVLALTLPEALWLAENEPEDIVVAYPTTQRGPLAALASSPRRERIAVMVDCAEHLDALERAGADPGAPVRVCIEADAGLWLLGGRMKLGAKRSPIHGPEQLAAFAVEVLRRPYLRMAGLMSYESQIAGVGDRPAGRPLRGRVTRAMQSRSRSELA